MNIDPTARALPCYAVPGDRLAEALAGELLTGQAESKPDRHGRDWLYHDGHAAGVRWSAELAATAERLQLDATAWLDGFIAGTLTSWPDRDASHNRGL